MPPTACPYCQEEVNKAAVRRGSCPHCGERLGGEFMAEAPQAKSTEFVDSERRSIPLRRPATSLLVEMPLITEGLEHFPRDREDGIFHSCINPYCGAILGSFPDDSDLIARCPACRCPVKIPTTSESEFADEQPEAFLATPENMQTLPFSADLFKFKLRSVDVGSLLTLGLVFALPGAVMGYLWSFGGADDGPHQWGVPLLVGSTLGFLVGLLLYFPMRAQERRRGSLAEVEGLREAARTGNISFLIAGIQYENRAVRVACARALLDRPDLIASAVPALIDLLWGRPSEYLRGAQEAGTELVCQGCGKELYFWNRARSNWVVGTNFCYTCWRSLARNPEVMMAEMLPSEGWAARALGLCGRDGLRALPALTALMDTTNVPSVYGEVVNAIEKIRGQALEESQDEEELDDDVERDARIVPRREM